MIKILYKIICWICTICSSAYLPVEYSYYCIFSIFYYELFGRKTRKTEIPISCATNSCATQLVCHTTRVPHNSCATHLMYHSAHVPLNSYTTFVCHQLVCHSTHVPPTRVPLNSCATFVCHPTRVPPLTNYSLYSPYFHINSCNSWDTVCIDVKSMPCIRSYSGEHLVARRLYAFLK